MMNTFLSSAVIMCLSVFCLSLIILSVFSSLHWHIDLTWLCVKGCPITGRMPDNTHLTVGVWLGGWGKRNEWTHMLPFVGNAQRFGEFGSNFVCARVCSCFKSVSAVSLGFKPSSPPPLWLLLISSLCAADLFILVWSGICNNMQQATSNYNNCRVTLKSSI